MDKKYQIFISSTYVDLIDERDIVTKAILEMSHIPVGMEMFSAGDEQQWEIIKRQIDVSDYYIVIIAHRYGSMDGDVSYTEKEYDYAKEKNIPVLAFVIEDKAVWPQDRSEKEPKNQKKLRELKSKVSGKYISRWSSKDDLYGKVSIALTKQMTSRPMVGWVRANEVAGPEVTVELSRLSKENSELRQKIFELDKESNTKVDFENLVEILSNITFNITYDIYQIGLSGDRKVVSSEVTDKYIDCLSLFSELASKISRIVKEDELMQLIQEVMKLALASKSIVLDEKQNFFVNSKIMYDDFTTALVMYDIIEARIESIANPASSSPSRYTSAYRTVRYWELSILGKQFYRFLNNL